MPIWSSTFRCFCSLKLLKVGATCQKRLLSLHKFWRFPFGLEKKIVSEHIWIDSPPFECQNCASPAGIVPVADAATSLASSWDIQIFQVPMDVKSHSPTSTSLSPAGVFSCRFVTPFFFAMQRLHSMRETQRFLCGLAQDRHWLLILESTRASGLCCPAEILLWVRPLSFFSPNRQWIPWVSPQSRLGARARNLVKCSTPLECCWVVWEQG